MAKKAKETGQQGIKQALNKGFRKLRPTRAEIETLKHELTKMLGEMNPKESEEYHKGLLRDFLNKTGFTEHFINTKDRSDLVIHNSKNSSSSVGVIIETKRPNNKTEMPTPQNLNKKAVQELLLYFLRERVTHKNFEIKHLIVTDLYQWFIFDAAEFERLSENTKLKKHFKDFEEGKLLFDKTDFFYKEIAAPILEQAEGKLQFTYFDIRDYEKHLESKSDSSDIQLIDLHKILSPVHLLKLSFTNDSNTLNQDFYSELLHIIGLEEYKEKSKKLIRRKEGKDRNDDSLIEATIAQLLSLDKLSRITDIEQFGDNRDDRLFNVSLELVITWINRVLFLKLLESQIVGYHNGNRGYLFLNIEKVPQYDDLNTLFFEVLAKLPNDRRTTIQQKFPNVPYLNSSLFDPTELEHEAIFISNLPDHTALPFHKKTILKNTGEKLNTLEYLFRFLDAYDFSSEGKEDISEDNKALINASVLGLIFEKINGYKDGSFFTPGFVTMYMCRETIRRAVIQKFKEQTSFRSDEYSDLVNYVQGTYKKTELEKYNTIINSLKICDPAVGSGHFLVSALNEIIAIKAELGILMDNTGKPLRDYLVDIENDELIILDHHGDFFKYDPEDRESSRVQKTLFYEKQTIIENCLFGVDINPNSVNICCLRLWIELLKNTFYKENEELETLPNIDINIKCGNSLICRYPLESDLKEVLRESKYSIDTYKNAVDVYRNATSKEEKRSMESLIHKIKDVFTEGVDKNHPLRKKLAKLKGQLTDLVDQGRLFEIVSQKAKKKKTDKLSKSIEDLEEDIAQIENGIVFKNAFEWRFEFPEVLGDSGRFMGFDVVIGNPPYGLFNKKQNQKIALKIRNEAIEVLKKTFPEAAHGVINACRLFFNLSLKISKDNGIQSMIIPFGILTDTTSSDFRRYIFDCHSFLAIDAFPERDNMKKRVFEDAKMSTAIVQTCKNRMSDRFNLGISYSRSIETEKRFDVFRDDILKSDPDLCAIPITSPEEYEVLNRVYSASEMRKLGSISKCLTGEADMTFAKKAMTKDEADAVLIKGVQIDRYLTKTEQDQISQGEIEYINAENFREVYKGKKLEHANKRRLVLQGLTGINESFRLKASIVEPPVYLANSCNYILDKEDMSLNVILGLINSKLLNFIFKCKSTSSNVNGYEVDNLPIPKVIDDKHSESIEKIVCRILSLKEKDVNAKTSQYESQVDEIVYDLYNVDKYDSNIIENQL